MQDVISLSRSNSSVERAISFLITSLSDKHLSKCHTLLEIHPSIVIWTKNEHDQILQHALEIWGSHMKVQTAVNNNHAAAQSGSICREMKARELFGLKASHPLRRVKTTLRNTKKFGGNSESCTDEQNFDFHKITLLNTYSQQICEIST